MGNVLCCLSSRGQNQVDDNNNPPIEIGKKDEISYKKKTKATNIKKSLTNKSKDDIVINNINENIRNNTILNTNEKQNSKKERSELETLTNEIQEKIFATKDQNEMNSLEDNPARAKTIPQNIKNEKLLNNCERKNSMVLQKRRSLIGGPLKLKNKKKDVEFLNIKIFVDNVDLNLKNFDKEIYGPYFQPYLDISFNNEKSRLVATNENQGDNTKNESINFSNLSNIDISTNNASNNGSFIMKSSKLGSVYIFKMHREFSIEKKKLENFDVNIEFSLKNNCKFKSANSNNNYNITNANINTNNDNFAIKNNSNLNISGISNNSIILNGSIITGDNIPIVLIGSGHINLNKFYCEMKQKIHDCYLELKLRKTLSIGFLKLVVCIEEIDKHSAFNPNNDISSDIDGGPSDFEEWLQKNKIGLANENLLNNNIYNKINHNDSLNLWENNYVNAIDLPDLVCEDFFNTDFKFAESNQENNMICYNNSISNNNENEDIVNEKFNNKNTDEENSKKSENSKKDAKNNLEKRNNKNKSNHISNALNDNINDNNNDNSFIDLNLNSPNEYKIIGINKKNYVGKSDSSSNKNLAEAKTDDLRILDRMNITNILIQNKSYMLANEMKANLTGLNINAEFLKEIFVEEIFSKIIFNKNGIFEINENFGNKEKIDLCKYNMYQFLLLLINLCFFEKFDVLIKFFDILSEDEKIVFFQITSFDRNNVYIYRNYLTLMSNYFMHFKNNLDESLRYRINIDQRVMIKTVFAILDNIKTIELNNKEIWERYVFEIKDCLISALNLIWDLCHEPLETPSEKDHKKQSKANDNKNKNRTNEMTLIYKNCLHTLTFRNKLIFLLKPFLNHSEIIGVIYKIFRKCFQNLTNIAFAKQIDLSQFCEFPEKIAESLIESLIDGDNKNSFIRYIEIIMLKYTHYPEIVKNCYSILLCILKKANEDHLGKFLLIFDLKKFQSSHEIYKFKLRASAKEINLFFINILLILVSFFQKKSTKEKLIDSNDDALHNQMADLAFKDKYIKILDFLTNIFASFFDTTHKHYIEFVKKKFFELQIQDLLLKIGSILFIYEANMDTIMQSDFNNNLIRYLLEFAFGKCEFKDPNNKNNLKVDANNTDKIGGFNYITYVNEKKMKNIEAIKKFVASIILNAFEIYKNLLAHDSRYFGEVGIKLTKYNIDDSDKLVRLFECCLDSLDRHNINLSLHKKVLREIIDSFENQEDDEEFDESEEN